MRCCARNIHRVVVSVFTFQSYRNFKNKLAPISNFSLQRE
jgi:hypothetical protein